MGNRDRLGFWDRLMNRLGRTRERVADNKRSSGKSRLDALSESRKVWEARTKALEQYAQAVIKQRGG